MVCRETQPAQCLPRDGGFAGAPLSGWLLTQSLSGRPLTLEEGCRGNGSRHA